MKLEFGDAVRERFEALLDEQLPGFLMVFDEPLPQGCFLYRCRAEGNVSFFVLLQCHSYEDWFTLELSWSRHGRYPLAFTVKAVSPQEAASRQDARFRLGRLWADADIWWKLRSPSLLERLRHEPVAVALEVEKAFQRLTTIGIDYFRQVAARLGVSATWESRQE